MRLSRSLLIAATVATADQLTKLWIVAAYPFGSETEVIPGVFRLVHTRNRGIAFGLFGASGSAVQLALLIVVAGVVGFVAWQVSKTGGDGQAGWGLALVLGGAVGNIIDRVTRGEVVDFLDFYLRLGGREHHWFAFNVADSAISVGACLVVLGELVSQARSKRAPSSD